MRVNKLTWLLWIFMLPKALNAQEVSTQVVVDDLAPSWLVYSEQTNSYIPYVMDLHDSEVISFHLDLNRYREYHLKVTLPFESALFIENAIVTHTSFLTTRMFPIDSLFEGYSKDKIFVSIYMQDQNIKDLQSYIVDLNPVRGIRISNTAFQGEVRMTNNMEDFFIISIIGLLGATALVRRNTKNVFNDYFALNRIVSLKIRYDNVASSNIFSTTNMAFHFFYGAILATSCVNFLVWTPSPLISVNDYNTPQLFALTIGLSLLFTCLMWGKYPLIRIISRLYNFRKFVPIQYFDYFRLTLIVTILLFVVSVVNNSVGGTLIGNHSEFFTVALVAILFSRPLLAFVKLIKFSNHRKLHLFSYLCTTEIIPLIILLKVFLK